jgi:multidrug efflux pump subunit AcrA (membrane-fusion protein)
MSRQRQIALVLLAVAVMRLAAVIIFALIKSPSARADEEEEKPITSKSAQISRDRAGHVLMTIAPAAQKEIGITTEVLKPVILPLEVQAYGFVLDPAPLAKLDSELMSAEAMLNAAGAQYRRTSRLYGEQKNASLRDLQTAEASYLTDKSQLEALQQLSNDWGTQISGMDARNRAHLVSALVERNEAIARVTAPIGDQVDDRPRAAEIVVLGHETKPLNARALYPAPSVVPTLQGQTFLVLIATEEFAVRPGMAITARIPTSNRSAPGVMVPRSAVVRYAGKEWVYRELNDHRFVRLDIVPAEIAEQGYFVTEILAPGMRIVITGAETLLSEERKAEIEIVE